MYVECDSDSPVLVLHRLWFCNLKGNRCPAAFFQTPVDKQELLCGQLAGVGRCVSELSSSPIRILRLRRNKYAIRIEDDFFWVSELQLFGMPLFRPKFEPSMITSIGFFLFSQALGCSVEVPTISVCELLDQLINLFCFYNGSVRLSYQVQSPSK